MTLFSDRIYSREQVLILQTEPIIPENSNFKFDIGFDKRNGRNEWKKREHRPKPVLIRGEQAWTSSKLKLDKTKVDEITNSTKKLLNKISEKNYEKILEQILLLDVMDDPFCLNAIVKEIFEKALFEPTFSKIYARICNVLIDKYNNFENVSFKHLLVANCQKYFMDRNLNELEEYDELIKKKKLIGNALFIAELFNLNHIPLELLINECILKLLNEKDNINQKNMEINLEIISNILVRGGKKFEDENKDKLDELIKLSNEFIKEQKLSSRIRFMFMDLNDIRKKNWVLKK